MLLKFAGTTKMKNLDANIGSLKLKLTEEDVKEISSAVPIDEVAGNRTYEGMSSLSWQFASTPKQESPSPFPSSASPIEV
ncbi:putative aldo-keto reductase 1 [Drosera capensis]